MMEEREMTSISTHIPKEVADELEQVVFEYRVNGLRINKCDVVSQGILMAVAEKRDQLKKIRGVIE